MGGILNSGANKSTSTTDKMAAGVRFQTSAFGLCWTLLLGRNRINGNLLDYQDFQSHAHTESQEQQQGGKGGGGAKSTHTSFTYTVAIILALIYGGEDGLPADAIKTVWQGKEKFKSSTARPGSSYPAGGIIGSPAALPAASPSLFELLPGALPQAPWGYMLTHHPERAFGYHALACAVAAALNLGDNENLPNFGFEMVGLLPYDQRTEVLDYQVTLPSDQEISEPIMVPAAPGPYTATAAHAAQWTRDVSLIDNSDPENPVPFTKVSGAPGPLEYNVALGEYTFNAGDAGKLLDATYGYQPDPMVLVVPEYLHFCEDLGVKSGGGVPFTLVTADPESGEYAPGSAPGYYQFSRFDSGISPKISYAFYDQVGAKPSAALLFFWTDSLVGLGQDAGKIAALTDYENYCLAHNWLVSPALTAQEPAKDVFDRILQITNAAPACFAGQIHILPLGDTPCTGNDITWTPDLTPVFDLTPEHFLSDGGKPPVRWEGVTPADSFNHARVEWCDKDNEYNSTTPAEYKDDADIEAHSLKTDPTTYKFHEITQGQHAQQVAQLKVNDSLYQPGAYEFNLPWHFGYLTPGDVGYITDPGLALDRQFCRIINRLRDPDGCYNFRVKPLTVGAAAISQNGIPTGSGISIDANVDPGDINTPVIFVPPAALLTEEMEVWAAVSGGVNYGGCNVFVSETGDNYKYAGQILGNARHGILTAALPAASANPDTIHTLSVDLSTSRGQLLSGAQSDAEHLNTLCKAGDEYLAYKTATLTSQYNYDLTWLNRGAYGSGMLERPEGADFVRLDAAIFKYACTRADIGKTIYIKFQAFNIYQRAVQDLADIDPYIFTITNPGDQALEPVVNLTSANNAATPDAKIDVAFDSCPLYNTAGSQYDSGALGFTIDAGVVGLNGLDTGSLAAATWYYLWAIADPVHSLVGGLLSLSSSAPTLPSGYTHKRLLGAVRTDAGAHFLSYNQTGDEVSYAGPQDLSAGTTAQNWTVQDASALVPPISIRAWISFLLYTLVVCDFGVRKNGSSGNGPISGTAEPGVVQGEDWVDLDSAQKLQLLISENVESWSLAVSGFKLAL